MLYLERSSCSSRGQTFSSCRGLGGEGQRKYYSVTLRTCYHQLQLIQGWIVKGFEVEVNSVLWFLVPQLATTCTPWSWTPPALKSGSRWRTGPGSVTAASLKYCSLDCSKWSTDTYGPHNFAVSWGVFVYLDTQSPVLVQHPTGAEGHAAVGCQVLCNRSIRLPWTRMSRRTRTGCI